MCILNRIAVFIYNNWYRQSRKYSVYYAHNMERKGGEHTEIAMAIEILELSINLIRKNIRYIETMVIYAIYNNSTDRKQAIISCDLREELHMIFYDVTDKNYYFNVLLI